MPAEPQRPPVLRAPLALSVEAVATGAWLGLVQVALGFALLSGGGSSSLIFFSLIAAWLAGGALGAGIATRAISGPLLLGLAIAGLAAARAALWRWPFSAGAACAGFASGALAGGYAGRFLRDRAPAWSDARRLLLHENNGFILGFAAGTALLFVSATALDVSALLLGLALLVQAQRRPLDHPISRKDAETQRHE